MVTLVIKHTYVFIIHLKSRLNKAINFDCFFLEGLQQGDW